MEKSAPSPAGGQPPRSAAGQLGDLPAGFVTAAVTWPGAPVPDPDVAAAFMLGWRVAQALQWAQAEQPPREETGLDGGLAWPVLIGQIEGARERLTKAAKAGASAAAPAAQAQTDEPKTLGTNPPPATKPQEVEAMTSVLLQELYIAATTLGRAFQLGHALHQMCALRAPVGGADSVAAALSEQGPTVKQLLGELASRLPANAAHSVINSMSLWEAEVAAVQPPGRRLRRHAPAVGPRASEQQMADGLQRQGAVWRALLAGELAAKDLLRLSDYVGSAEEVVGRLRELTVGALRGKLLPWVLLVLALIVAGVLVLVLTDSASGVTAGASSLIAAFGLSWKGIGQLFGRAAAKGEQALWDAQLDWTIAYRCTISPDQPAGHDLKRDERLYEHLQMWKRWQRRWPDQAGELGISATNAGEQA